MFKLYFLAGVMTEETLEDYQTTLEQLKNGELNSLSFEKLRGYSNIYSVRDNRKGRLLISFPLVNGERSLVILEALPNHEYAKSRVLRSGLIQHYLTNFKQSLEQPEFEPLDTLDEVTQLLPNSSSSTASWSSHVIAKPVYYYFSSYIEHSVEQTQAIEIKAPQLITGPSGSGKSCVAVAKARALYNAMNTLEAGVRTITYIAPTKALCAQVEASFKATLPASTADSVIVNFLTAKEWVDITAEITVVGFEAFEKVLENAKGIIQLKGCHQLQSLVQLKNKNRKTHLQKIYTEMQLIAVHTEQEYLGLGIRESLYDKKDIRQDLLVLFRYYLDHLKAKNLCDLGLNSQDFFKSSIKAQGMHYVLVDEAQSIAPMVLKLVIGHYGPNSYFFADSNQNTETLLSILPLLKKWLVQHSGEKVTLATNRLEICYRCPEAIAAAANWVLKLKQHLAQGIADKSETVEVLPVTGILDKGYVGIIQPQATSLMTLKQQLAQQSLRYAVIAPTASITKAKQTFPEALVFTVQEIRGLQFEHIIAYELFSTKEMQALNDKLRQLKNEGMMFDPKADKEYKHLPKKDAANDIRFNPELNALFIAFTRAMKSLWIVEDYEQHSYEFTARSLYGYLNPALPLSQPTQVVEQGPLEYLELVKQLLVNGNESQAQAVFSRYHQGEPEDFERLKQCLHLAQESSSSQDVESSFSSANSSSSNTHVLSNTNESNGISLSSDSKKIDNRQRRPRYKPQKNSSSKVYKLSLNKEGRIKLLNQYQQKSVDINELCAIDAEDQVPALYWLAAYPEGHILFSKLSDEQIRSISTQALCAIHRQYNVPMLYFLAVNENFQKCAVLGKLSDKQIKGIDTKVLCAMHSERKVSALFVLSDTLAGRNLLASLTVKQVEDISAQALCVIHPEYQVPVLYCLAVTLEGRALLDKLSKKQIQGISALALSKIDPERKVSALYWLAANPPEGPRLLDELSIEQIQGITTKALCAIHPENQVSMLYWLAANPPKGSILLSKLSTQQIRNINAEVFNIIYSREKVPALYWLSRTSRGTDLLGKLSVKQVQGISGQALSAVHSKHRVSALYFLANNFQEGSILLSKLSTEQIHNIDAEAFNTIHSAEKVSALYWLSRTSEGTDLLGKLSDKQIQGISGQALSAIHSEHRVSALYFLANNFQGCTWLNRLSAEQIQGISAQALNVIHPYFKVPALYWLARTPEGVVWLDKLSDEQIEQLNPKVFFELYDTKSLDETQSLSLSTFDN